MAIKDDSRTKKAGAEQITIEVDLHEAQQEIFDARSEIRFRVAACGRRFGKTVEAAVECLVEAIANPGAMVWWVAPTTKQTRIAKRQLTKMLPRHLYHVNNTLGEFTLANGSHIFLRSAERFDNLRGEGVDFMVVDEAAFIDEEAWTDALRPSLSDKEGGALLISTFKGENWFWKLHQDAQDPKNFDWEAFTFPTARNPYIPPTEIDAARRSMPHAKFAQEFECSVLSFVGAIFEGELVQAAAERGKETGATLLAAAPRQYDMRDPRAQLVMHGCEAGIDWGWHVTALEVCYEGTDDRITWIYEHLFEHVELNKRCAAIVAVAQELNIEVFYTDAAGASENVTLAVALAKAGLKTEVQPVPFNQYKTVGIDTRRYYLENQLEDISPHCKGLITDSKRYHYDVTGEKPAKGDDHTVDACTAFYASRADVLQGIRDRAMEEAVA